MLQCAHRVCRFPIRGSLIKMVARALVIDDNVDVAESLTWLLEGLAHEVKFALSGAAALQLASDFRPEIIFCDIVMPEMDGYETCRRLRQLPGLEHVVIVAVSGYGRPEDLEMSEEAGFDRHLVKPVSPSMLRDLIGSLSMDGNAEREG